jgi:hypothetical protein
MTVDLRSVGGLVLAVAAAIGAGLCWVGARSAVVDPPIASGEPKMTSVAYDPTLLALMLLLAAVSGVLAVLAIARLRR